jgi:hypothetical protein
MRDPYKTVTLPSPPLLAGEGIVTSSHGVAGTDTRPYPSSNEEMTLAYESQSQHKADRLPIFAAPLLKGFHGAPIALSKGRVKRKLDASARRNWAKRRAFKD